MVIIWFLKSTFKYRASFGELNGVLFPTKFWKDTKIQNSILAFLPHLWREIPFFGLLHQTNSFSQANNC